jgi:hypothetical protein
MSIFNSSIVSLPHFQIAKLTHFQIDHSSFSILNSSNSENLQILSILTLRQAGSIQTKSTGNHYCNCSTIATKNRMLDPETS